MLARWFALTCIAASLLGCPTRGEFKDLEGRVNALERSQGRLDDQIATSVRRLENLHALVEEATALLQKNGARLNAKLDGLESDQRIAAGKIEELFHAMEGALKDLAERRKELEVVRLDLESLRSTLRDRAGIAELALPKDLPSDAPGLLAEARKRLKIDDVLTARAVCREIMKRHMSAPEAVEARLLLGDTYAAEKRWADAVKEYQAVHDAYAQKAEAPAGRALLRIAEAMEAKKECRKAVDVYRYLQTSFKKLAEAKEAGNRLKDMKKRCPK